MTTEIKLSESIRIESERLRQCKEHWKRFGNWNQSLFDKYLIERKKDTNEERRKLDND
jgi:hypothetical protein